jgi:hypothetical protein
VSKPENRRAGPGVNGNPGPPRVFQVVDNFNGTCNRSVGHGRRLYNRLPPAAGHLASRARADKRQNAAVSPTPERTELFYAAARLWGARLAGSFGGCSPAGAAGLCCRVLFFFAVFIQTTGPASQSLWQIGADQIAALVQSAVAFRTITVKLLFPLHQVAFATVGVALRSVVMVRKLVTIVGSGMGLGIDDHRRLFRRGVERAASRSTARGMRLGWSGMTSP